MLLPTLKWLGLALGVLLLAALAFLWWASGGQTDAALVSPGALTVRPDAPGAAPADRPPAAITAISFNIGYGRGPAGDYSGPWTREHITRHLDLIADQIRASGADLAALQEVDLDAARSHHIDQGRYLLDRLGWPGLSCVTTWENNYVPFPYWPPSRHYGAMKSGQCLLSRWPITSTTRHRLAQPESMPAFKRAFYLHRAVDHAIVALPDAPLHVLNVHLEAFDAPNRRAQVDALAALASAAASPRLLVLGDFNALPPGTTPTRGFPDEPDNDYADSGPDGTIAAFAAATGLREVLLHDRAVLTHPADAPTRRLDYVFHGASLALIEARALSAPPLASDHLPVVARFALSAAR